MNVKTLAGIGNDALVVAGGNQVKRYQRQNAKNKATSKIPRQRNMRRVRQPLIQTQDNSIYHDNAAELAASISSYRYGAKIPGYMT